jgi:hypothetical protein
VSYINLAVRITAVKDVAAIAWEAVQIVGVIVAALWAYWRFIRGRVFHLRADVQVSCELLGAGPNDRALRVQVVVSNVGDSKLALLPGSSRVDVAFLPAAMAVSAVTSTRPDAWQSLSGGDLVVLPEQEALEAREAVRDEILVPLPPAASSGYPWAYRVTATVASPSKNRGSLVWIGRSIVTTDWSK